MSNIPCDNNRLIAQTLFLGASVNSFNSSVGWGSQPSQCTVALVEDTQPVNCLFNFNKNGPNTNLLESRQFAPPTGIAAGNDADIFPINHYYESNDADNPPQYVTPQGEPFDITKHKLSDRMVPGKVYYNYLPYTSSKTSFKNSIVSKYWFNGDPGFFGKPTRIGINGSYYPGQDVLGFNKGYDIIDTPVYFKMGDFSFGGLVQSWSKSTNNGGIQYSVVINSMQSLLSSCYIILDKFSGSIFSKWNDNSAIYGSPKNYTGMAKNSSGAPGITYGGSINEGNIPNVFNIYGFLESMGYDNFGSSKINDNGISANKIVDALTVLTSIGNKTDITGTLLLNSPITNRSDWATKNAYSPFGRIISKCMQEYDTYNQITTSFNKFGVIPPTPTINESVSSNRCQFLLDLSELPRTPDDFRVQGPVMSVMDLINTIGEQTGHDFTVDLMPVVHTDGIIYNIIKVKTISRLKQPRTNLIENTIKELQCNNVPFSSITIGKEKNETHARSIIVGGQQQRLYQTKSYRLSYSQTNYIFNPRTYEFVDYMKLGTMDPAKPESQQRNNPFSEQKQFHHGKIKFPNFLSTRNIDLSNNINPDYGPVLDDDDEIQNITEGLKFNKNDNDWSDHLQTGGITSAKALGNYKKAEILKQELSDNPTWGSQPNNTQRFFPLYKDTICPFFGYVQEEEININIEDGKNNDFKKIRPVWFDTWTGQIVIVVRLSELPLVSIPLTRVSFLSDTMSLVPPYSSDFGDYFILTESEIRAAIAGFDNFLVYSLAKAYKPDLIEILRRAHVNSTKTKLIKEGYKPEEAESEALNVHNWYWRLQTTNIAGYFNQPTPLRPDKSDGSGNIPESTIKDIQIIHNFVSQMSKYYGKKYMVTAKGLQSYRDEAYADLTINTQIGDAYVFNGGGSFKYNYTPTNDGAWEEYGNIIDDTIAVGGQYWYNLTDDAGKIKPLLGYNANEYFDYIRYSLCKTSQIEADKKKKDSINPYWSFNSWKELLNNRDTICLENNFVFPSLDFSGLGTTEYSLISVSGNAPQEDIVNSINLPNVSMPITTSLPSQAYDSYGKLLVNQSGVPLLKKKLYIPTTVQESFIYLDPINLLEPKILIDSPGIFLNTSSTQYAKDPNRTVIANTSIEDLVIYLKSVKYEDWDYEWIKYQLHWISPVMGKTSFLLGNSASSANSAAKHVEISAKAAHPFFAAIPIKSNQFTYGPWTNYPYLQHLSDPQSIFPSGVNINQTSTSCTSTNIVIDNDTAKKAINNWIVPTHIEINPDFVPWNYGGMSFLDQIALNEIQTKINYQNILETAQLEIVGLPLFNLGGNFSFNNIISSTGNNFAIKNTSIIYTDIKSNPTITFSNISSDFALPSENISNSDSQQINYNCFGIDLSSLFTSTGPIITNINVEIGQQGIKTTYSFRTYTKKLGLFNKENSDRLKFMFTENQKRNKQLSNISQQSTNLINSQLRFIEEQRISKPNTFGISNQKTKLFGWSPALVLISQATPYIEEPIRKPKYIEDYSLFTTVTKFNTKPSAVQAWKIPTSLDPGDSSSLKTPTGVNDSIIKLNSTTRVKGSVSLFERKEVDSQLNKDYGLQSAMSLDGLFSPISYYPTLKNSTYNFSLYDSQRCPFCQGTKKRTIEYATYYENTRGVETKEVYCDKCSQLSDKLNAKLKTTTDSNVSSELLPPYIITTGTDFNTLLKFNNINSSFNNTATPINLVSLNPIMLPQGEFKNPNSQADDRSRHCIEIIGRGSVPPEEYRNSLETSRNINRSFQGHNADYSSEDMVLKHAVSKGENTDSVLYEMNQRFLGLRGPLMMHSWGYDKEGYPTPNASDEPYETDEFLRPKRFKQRILVSSTTGTYESLNIGDSFKLNTEYLKFDQNGDPSLKIMSNSEEMTTLEQITGSKDDIFTKTFNQELLPIVCSGITFSPVWKQLTTIQISGAYPLYMPAEKYSIRIFDVAQMKANHIVGLPQTAVFKVSIYDDLTDPGGFDPDIYKGSPISKSQIWTANQPGSSSTSSTTASNLGRWSEKVKSNDFYLNWAERPDLWPVGPIDLRWDSDRKIWSIPNNNTSYKLVYITLEEDLVKDDDYDETYPARGFLDDLEYSKEPLRYGQRRLVYVKDKTGYTAPRGIKLLCRYDRDSGFYEPISKPSIMAVGKIDSGNKAIIEMTYVQGRKKGEIPTMLVTFDNSKFNLSYTQGKNGMFNYLAGQWILTNVQQ
jgi:hypothetical protein